MNRLLILKTSLISQTHLDQEELNFILFGPNHKDRSFAWEVVRNNPVLQDHFHLNNYTLQQIREKTLHKMLLVTKKSPNF